MTQQHDTGTQLQCGTDSRCGADDATASPYTPYALTPHDAAWGAVVILLSVGMFVVTPLLAVLRAVGVLPLDLGWVFLPAIMCVAAVFLHGCAELVRALARSAR
jgi:hypothetical protein